MNDTDTRKPTFVTPQAHDDLLKLAELLTESKGVKISRTIAGSLAIANELRRQQRLAERRAQRQQTA